MQGGRTTGLRAALAISLIVVVFGAVGPLSAPAAGAATRAARGFDFNGDGYRDLVIAAPGDEIGPGRDGADAAGAVNVLYGGPNGVTAAGDEFISQQTAGLGETPEYGDQFGRAFTSADFNRDGFADLAIGVPGESVAGQSRAGAVHVLFGDSSGLTTVGSQLWDDTTAGDVSEAHEAFGTALATADWSGDGFADLAIGVPLQEVSGVARAGAVQILRGSATGLTNAGGQRWSQDSPGVPNHAELLEKEFPFPEWFGAALAAGDVNGDGRADLAVGVPGETVPAHDTCREHKEAAYGAGAVHMLFGGTAGLTADGSEFWHQNRAGVAGIACARYDRQGFPPRSTGERFGSAVVIGDFNGDGHGDVAAGTPWDHLKRYPHTDCGDNDISCDNGSVNVLYGGATGLRTRGDDLWHLDVPGIEGRYGGWMGTSLAAGRATRDTAHELAIGIPGSTQVDDVRGGVLVLRGSPSGLVEDGDRLWTQATPGMPGASGAGFGLAVAFRQLGGSVRPELVVGVPEAARREFPAAGRVVVLYGSRTGPSTDTVQSWHRGTDGVLGSIGSGDQFGYVAPLDATEQLTCLFELGLPCHRD